MREGGARHEEDGRVAERLGEVGEASERILGEILERLHQPLGEADAEERPDEVEVEELA